MATTALTLQSNRWRDCAFLSGASATVPIDAIVGEVFTLPVAFGDMIIDYAVAGMHTFSGTYVAVAPPDEGYFMSIYNATGTLADIVGAERFVHYGTSSARPFLASSFKLERAILLRQDERIQLSAPVLAGAGVTATVTCFLRGVRLRQS